MQLDDASGVLPWLKVSSVEFAKKVGAGAHVMSGCFSKSVCGSVGALEDLGGFVCPAQLKSLGHCVLISS